MSLWPSLQPALIPRHHVLLSTPLRHLHRYHHLERSVRVLFTFHSRITNMYYQTALYRIDPPWMDHLHVIWEWMEKFSQPILLAIRNLAQWYLDKGDVLHLLRDQHPGLIIIRDQTKGDGLPPFPDQQPRPALDLLTPVQDSRNFPTTPFLELEICFKMLFLPSHLWWTPSLLHQLLPGIEVHHLTCYLRCTPILVIL